MGRRRHPAWWARGWPWTGCMQSPCQCGRPAGSFRGMTAREISEDDGIPLGTVKTRLRSALIKVRQANQQKETP